FDDDILNDPDLAPWYYIPFNTGQIWFETADFYDYDIGTGYAFTDTVSMPLIRDGKIVGVAGIDTLYTDQFRFIGDRDIPNERMLLLQTQAGEIVYSSDNRFLTEFIFDLPDGNIENIRFALNSYSISIFEGKSPFSGVQSVLSFTPVYAEYASQQLYLYIEIPSDVLLRPAHDAMRMITVLSVAGLFMIGIIQLLIIRSTIKPIGNLIKNANRIAGGELDADFASGLDITEDSVVSSNEIVLLTAALNKMIDRLRQVRELELKEQTLVADNELLDRLNRMKTEFFQNMSHDFKTPLNVISTSVNTVRDMFDYSDDKDTMRNILKSAQDEAMRMSRMVDSSLTYSSLSDNRLIMEEIDLALLLRESAETYRALLDRHENILRVEIPETFSPISGNADMLLHVLSNLLSNANRYTRGGEIVITATQSDGLIIVKVIDNGSGVRPELLPRIFERGVSESGTGLGLSICKTAIESHGGKIDIYSKINEGTTVEFTIPIVKNGGMQDG
ncbi:MAG: sensor histidine kinase, partial [Oscillospiraceae bacterium]|nr:sensor histidine kinase [Oscillospiraceae bacterium]